MMGHEMAEWLNATAERIADALERIANALEARAKEAKEAAEAAEILQDRIAEAEARRRNRMGG